MAHPSVGRLTFDGLEKRRPCWSPDGSRLYFGRHESDGAHIWQYVMEAGKPDSARRLTDRKTPEYDATPSPDGKRVLLTVVPQSGDAG